MSDPRHRRRGQHELVESAQTVLMAAAVTLAFMIFVDAAEHSPTVVGNVAQVPIEGYLETMLLTPWARFAAPEAGISSGPSEPLHTPAECHLLLFAAGKIISGAGGVEAPDRARMRPCRPAP